MPKRLTAEEFEEASRRGARSMQPEYLAATCDWAYCSRPTEYLRWWPMRGGEFIGVCKVHASAPTTFIELLMVDRGNR